MANETAYQQAASTAASDVSRLAGDVADQASVVGTEAIDTLTGSGSSMGTGSTGKTK